MLAGLFLFGGYVLQTVGLRYTSASKAGVHHRIHHSPGRRCSAASYIRRAPAILAELLGVAIAFLGMALMTVPGGRFQICCRRSLGFRMRGRVRVPHPGHSAVSQARSISARSSSRRSQPGPCWAPRPSGGSSRSKSTGARFWIRRSPSPGSSPPRSAFTVQTWAQRWTSPTRTALIFAMEPVFAWITSYLVAGEVLSRRATLGAALIIGGILMVELKPFRLGQHPLT